MIKLAKLLQLGAHLLVTINVSVQAAHLSTERITPLVKVSAKPIKLCRIVRELKSFVARDKRRPLAVELLNRRVGPSTGTNFYAVLQLAQGMRERNETGSIVSLICDSGERYRASHHCDEWLEKNHLLWGVQHQEQLIQSNLKSKKNDGV